MGHTVVGKLNKAFGVKGHIKVVPQKAFVPDLQKSDVWFIQRGTDIIPYFVESIENDPHFLIKFEDIDSPEAAKNITGCPILLRESDITIQTERFENDLDKLIGFTVIDSGKELGVIERIEEFPQQLMAFILLDDVEIMMPLIPEFIEDIISDTKRLIVFLPEGFVKSQLG